MKLSSRPGVYVAGEGPFTMKFTLEELEYIAAMVYVTRLGGGPHSDAAFNILTNLDEMFDEDFAMESARLVNMEVSILDDHDNVVTQHHHTNIAIEV